MKDPSGEDLIVSYELLTKAHSTVDLIPQRTVDLVSSNHCCGYLTLSVGEGVKFRHVYR